MNEEYNIKIIEFNKEEQTIEILGHKIDKSYESWEAFLEEMKRLTLIQNNWNELKKWCKENQYNNAFDSYQVDNYTTYGVILKKMQELEQGKDESN